jgi:hypothetical protein
MKPARGGVLDRGVTCKCSFHFWWFLYGSTFSITDSNFWFHQGAFNFYRLFFFLYKGLSHGGSVCINNIIWRTIRGCEWEPQFSFETFDRYPKITAKYLKQTPWCSRPKREGGCSLRTKRDTTNEHKAFPEPKERKWDTQLLLRRREFPNLQYPSQLVIGVPR